MQVYMFYIRALIWGETPKEWQNLHAIILGWIRRNNCGKLNYIQRLKKNKNWKALFIQRTLGFDFPSKKVSFLLVQRGHLSYWSFNLLFSGRKEEVKIPFLHPLFFLMSLKIILMPKLCIWVGVFCHSSFLEDS